MCVYMYIYISKCLCIEVVFHWVSTVSILDQISTTDELHRYLIKSVVTMNQICFKLDPIRLVGYLNILLTREPTPKLLNVKKKLL